MQHCKCATKLSAGSGEFILNTDQLPTETRTSHAEHCWPGAISAFLVLLVAQPGSSETCIQKQEKKQRKTPRALFWGNAVANLTASQLLCSVTQGVTPVCAAWDARVGKFVQKESRAEVRVFVTNTHSNSQVNFTYTEKRGSSPLVALSQGCTTPPRSAGATVLILYSFSYSTSTPNALLPKL